MAEAEDKISYIKELQDNLVTMLREEELNSYKKVVLHIPFKIKRYEIDSLQNALSQFEGIEFKVIKINVKGKILIAENGVFENESNNYPNNEILNEKLCLRYSCI